MKLKDILEQAKEKINENQIIIVRDYEKHKGEGSFRLCDPYTSTFKVDQSFWIDNYKDNEKEYFVHVELSKKSKRVVDSLVDWGRSLKEPHNNIDYYVAKEGIKMEDLFTVKEVDLC